MEQKKVLLFLPQGFEEMEASAFTDIIGWTKYANTEVKLVTTALRQEINCTWNLIARAKTNLSEISSDDFDALAIPGGFTSAGYYDDAYDEKFLQLIRDFDKKKKIIASICVGAMPIAKSGVLNGRHATTYDLDGGIWRQSLEEMGAIVENKDIVIDDNIITSTGPVTSTKVAFHLLEMLTDAENVKKVKHLMRFLH